MSTSKNKLDTGLIRELAAILREGDLGEIEIEHDGLKLRVVRSVATADTTNMAGMVKAPSRGVPRSLADFDPASLLTRSRRGRS